MQCWNLSKSAKEASTSKVILLPLITVLLYNFSQYKESSWLLLTFKIIFFYIFFQVYGVKGAFQTISLTVQLFSMLLVYFIQLIGRIKDMMFNMMFKLVCYPN